MILRNSTRPRPIWTLLPAEIRLLILEEVTHQRHPGWASLASVCREWQLVIERENFNKLRLQLPGVSESQIACLDEFERKTARSKHLVRHLEVDIQLPGYGCPACRTTESGSRLLHSSSPINNGIRKLFSVLSTWEHSITLELNAHSPSDSDHCFQGCHFTFNNGAGSGDVDGMLTQHTGNESMHDPKHGWVNGQQIRAPPRSAILRLFTFIYLSCADELPQVRCVTRWIIRRQLRRRLHPIGLQSVLRKLCRLEHLIYEPWRAWDRISGTHLDQRMSLLP